MDFSCKVTLNSMLREIKDLPCIREEDHIGKHQNFLPNPEFPSHYFNIYWNEEDGETVFLKSPPLWNECKDCGISILDEASACDDCLLEDRIHEIVKTYGSKIIITEGNILVEDFTEPSKVLQTVIWLDKTKEPFVSGHLINMTGRMPKRYRDALPDNAFIKVTEPPEF